MITFKELAALMRKGRNMVDGQAEGDFAEVKYPDWDEEEEPEPLYLACAVGCIGLGIGIEFQALRSNGVITVNYIMDQAGANRLEKIFPDRWIELGAPAEAFTHENAVGDEYSLGTVLTWINDYANWTIEQIAEWLEGLPDELA